MKKIMSFFKSLCTPAIVSLFLAVIFTLLEITEITKTSILFSVVHLIFSTIWALFLDFLCKKGLTTLSWILVMAPVLLVIIIMAFAYGIVFTQTNPKETQEILYNTLPADKKVPAQAPTTSN
jgi:hypothetical protein